MVILMESFFIGSFWSAMVSYVSLSVLKLFAVWKPFHYRKWFTMKRCIYLIVFRSRNSVTVFVYFFTLFVFIGTVILIRRAQRFVDSFKKRDSNKSEGGRLNRIRFPLWKLALNVATFAGLYLFYVIWCVGLLLNTDQCFFQRNYPEMMRILAFVRCSLLLRILVDPILSFITDYQLRRGLLALFGVNRKITFTSSNEIFKKSTYSDSSVIEHPPGIERVPRCQTAP
uniref:G_PROTEIN_RECEP_F1_2 domain-containing protein n=1 Tax=Heterorhabditis bacteriophora TaxID=37862 RepID=A0A1I7XG69_HETBA